MLKVDLMTALHETKIYGVIKLPMDVFQTSGYMY